MRVITYCVPDHTEEELIEIMIETLSTTLSYVQKIEITKCSKIETRVRSVALNITVDDNICDNDIVTLGSIIGSLICTRCLGQ